MPKGFVLKRERLNRSIASEMKNQSLRKPYEWMSVITMGAFVKKYYIVVYYIGRGASSLVQKNAYKSWSLYLSVSGSKL